MIFTAMRNIISSVPAAVLMTERNSYTGRIRVHPLFIEMLNWKNYSLRDALQRDYRKLINNIFFQIVLCYYLQ